MAVARTRTGLILTGGGARAAYQVGVLHAVADVWADRTGNPFPIVCGTSAGAINATALACNAGEFRQTVGELLRAWRGIDIAKVYRAGPLGVGATASRWLAAMMLGGLGRSKPAFLLDNAPLRALLESRFAFDRIGDSIATGNLHALAINATGYTSGQSVTFFEAAASVQPWTRTRRLGVRASIGVDHLMASSAIPLVCPAVRIQREFFGDGSMRQIAPLSTALRLGADRVMVVAVGRLAKSSPPRYTTPDYPSIAQIAGQVLSSMFLDTLEVDLERLQRINRTVGVMPAELRARHGVALKQIDTFVIAPSEDIEPIAARFAHRMPRAVRYFLRGIGATGTMGSSLLSYVLFDRDYCRALIRLGYRDAMARRGELVAFLAGADTGEHARAGPAPLRANGERAVGLST